MSKKPEMSMEKAIRIPKFCPFDGKPLSHIPEWESENEVSEFFTCGEHYFDRYKHSTGYSHNGDGLELIELKHCKNCGQTIPPRSYREVCNKCHQAECDTFHLDPESSARIKISPVRTADGRQWWDIRQELELKPYPNPYSYGGFFGMGKATTQEELDQVVKSFRDEVKEWHTKGLPEVIVEMEPEKYIIKQTEMLPPGKEKFPKPALSSKVPSKPAAPITRTIFPAGESASTKQMEMF